MDRDSDGRIHEGREKNGPTLPENTETVMERSEDIGEDQVNDELLPGIPNNITLEVIGPKLCFKDLNTLSFVNKNWHQAILSRAVYDAKVRRHSTDNILVQHRWYTETHLVEIHGYNIGDVDDNKYSTCLYCIRDEKWYCLPPMNIPGGFRSHSTCISLEGKIYILGGYHEEDKEYWLSPGCKEVYVLDLAGACQWKKCASMESGRSEFGAGVLDGKIYVFGGTQYSTRVHKCEVYDPKADAWSPIADMISGMISGVVKHQVATLGGELFVYGGLHSRRGIDVSDGLLAYHPVKNEWRQIEGSQIRDGEEDYWQNAFVAQGKFHRMSGGGIDVYDIDKNSWSLLHSFTGFPDGLRDPVSWYRSWGLQILALGDELFMLQHFGKDTLLGPSGPCFLQTQGFGGNKIEISLQHWEIKNSLYIPLYCSADLCLIQV